MNKADLINSISEQTGLTKTKSSQMVDIITSTIANALSKGEKVTLVGFGTFTTSERGARKGRNPKTGEVIDIAAKRVAKFKASSVLTEGIN
jgi:DNA-binding protein HU-beta